MKTPNYIIIGAMKCGTSTLAAQLGAQKGLFMTDPKEPQYFSDDPEFAKGPQWYSSLYDSADAGDILGEASTHYTKLPTYPDTVARIKAACPDLKLVYMIRNPVARVVSHYIHAWSEGELSCPIDEALKTEPNLVNYGLYAMQIRPFIDAYGKDAILLTSLERMKQDPQGELARVAAHIGHQGPVQWDDGNDRENVSAERVRRLPLQGLLVDNPLATALRQNLIPKSVRTWVRNSRKMKDRPTLPEAARPGLEKRFIQDRAELAEYFPGDPSLTLCYPFVQSEETPVAKKA